MSIYLGGGAVYPTPVIITYTWANQAGPSVWDICTGAYMDSLVVSDPDGDNVYLVPRFIGRGVLQSPIYENDDVYDWCDEKVQEAGYAPLVGQPRLEIEGENWPLSLAYNFKTNTYDLIAFKVTSEESDDGTEITYTAGEALVIQVGESVELPDSWQSWIDTRGQAWLVAFLAKTPMNNILRGISGSTSGEYDFQPYNQM